MLLRLAATAIVALWLTACASTAPAPRQTYSFGLWGDMPYKKAGDDPRLPAVLQSINQSDVSFSLFDGDIKDGSSQCSDDVYTDALKMFGSMDKPVVYTSIANARNALGRFEAGDNKYSPIAGDDPSAIGLGIRYAF